MKTYLFYDVETSGLNPAFDQILTFASIRTDMLLNEISRDLITINLRKDIVPSPQAFITHCLTKNELDAGMTEYQAARKIHKLFNTPGSISLGYNSLGFDDDFLRFLFYRNLLDPYAHQYANQCFRMDLLPVTTLFRIFCDHVIKWPYLEDGRPSLKLELLSSENGFVTSGRAHEALNDVEAVIELVRIFSRQAEVWSYSLDFFNKIKDAVRISTIDKDWHIGGVVFRICLMVSASFGSKNNYIAPVIHLGESVPYKNQSLWLRLDREGGFEPTEDSDLLDLFVIRKRPGDQLIVLPVLDRFRAKVTPAALRLWADNLAKIQGEPELFLKTIQHHRGYEYPQIPDIDPDAALYQAGFFSGSEKKEINRFHNCMDSLRADKLKPDELKAMVCEEFASMRIKTMAMRILYRNCANLSAPGANEEYSYHLERLFSETPGDGIPGYRNDVKYGILQGMGELREIYETEKELTPLQSEILTWLTAYLETLISSNAQSF